MESLDYESTTLQKMMKRGLLVVFVWCLSSAIACAGPQFAHIFADNAVLQRDQPLTIWGFGADPSTSLKIKFADKKVPTTINGEGKWQATLPALSASNEGSSLELIENGKTIAMIKDLVVGEVWLAAGQSNMEFRFAAAVKNHPENQAWVAKADQGNIRYRRIGDKVLSDRKTEAVDLGESSPWVPMTPANVLNFSAVSAVFASEIEAALHVPVGIIDVSWGGKPIEPFIPREAFSTPFLKEILDLADADNLDALSQMQGGVIIRNPEGHPGAIFNARIAPIVGLGLRGFLWYQAESNAGTGEDPRGYRHKMESMIRGWRTRWNDENLPCYFVQLPSFPPAAGWIRVREEQRLASLTIPHTGMAVIIDLPGDDIHPPHKIPVGERLAKLALTGTYGKENVVSAGPMYQSHEVNDSEITIHFSDYAGGLNIHDGDALQWFEIAGADGIWHPAAARIQGETVIATSTAVEKPTAVRYACATNPRGGNLFNGAGLPASPFCSDLEMLPWNNPTVK